MKTERAVSLPGRLLLTALTLAVMAAIFIFSTEPAEQSDQTSGWISESVDRILWPDWDTMPRESKEPIYFTTQTVIRKCAHFTEYTVLGCLLLLTLRSWMGERERLRLIAWLAGTCYAMTDELHQLLVDGRSGQWQDVMLDSAGVLTGVLITWGILKRIRRRREKQNTEPSPGG